MDYFHNIKNVCVYIPHKREQSGDELKKMNVINGRMKRIQKKYSLKKPGNKINFSPVSNSKTVIYNLPFEI